MNGPSSFTDMGVISIAFSLLVAWLAYPVKRNLLYLCSVALVH
ncbi:MAG: hypothetical protein Ct9H300mP23_05240 [Nitrospinota bacterium]|nr:MAG: hypothetical protein Ct9H300mP23_05240 [Nitrospinota bacterium]